MPVRPFPFQLSIGTDICRIARIRDIITKPPIKPDGPSSKSKFIRLLLTPRERGSFRNYLMSIRPNPDLSLDENAEPSQRAVQFLAGRFAAKEAIIKAVKPRKLTFQDISLAMNSQTKELVAVVLDPASKESGPTMLYDDARSPAWKQTSGQKVKINISHDGEYATAVCLAPEIPAEGDVGGEAAAREG